MGVQEWALVTGGARGIGAAISLALARAGFRVLVNHRGAAGADGLVADIRAQDGCADPIEFDVAMPASIERALVAARVEKLAVLVNNAGIIRDNLLLSVPRADLHEVLGINFVGAVNTFRACESLLKNGGRVINIGSISGFRGGRGQSTYATSKALLRAWTEEMARRYDEAIRFYCVAPGPVATDMVKSARFYQDPQARKLIPAGRYAEPSEIADVVVALARAPGRLCNGVHWVADGGFTLSMKA